MESLASGQVKKRKEAHMDEHWIFIFAVAIIAVLVYRNSLKEKISSLEDIKRSQIKTIEFYRNQIIQQDFDVKRLKKANSDLTCDISQLKRANSNLAIENEDLQKIIYTPSQSSPWLAERIAEYYHMRDEEKINAIPRRTTKKEEMKRLAKEKRDILRECNELRSQLSYLFYMFPWMDEYITIPPLAGSVTDSTAEAEYENLKEYLSPIEYSKLSLQEKYQLALDRYESKKMTKWEIGIQYERYVGYVYEQHGFAVEYRGALDGCNDMGRDIIAKKDCKVYVIQCKRWSQFKTIHENHIFQLYGSSVLYQIDHPKETVLPLFVTTTALSDRANTIAKILGIVVRQDLELKKYPKIKCNIGKGGEKIYHLPFDQQYDRVVINKSKGECYCMTVAEAESLGFRRAHEWHGSG